MILPLFRAGYEALPQSHAQSSRAFPASRFRLSLTPRYIGPLIASITLLGVILWQRSFQSIQSDRVVLPSYEEFWETERRLPQHDLSNPWPEGKNGRFVWFEPYHGIGFNNQLQDIIMVSQIAYMANRAYAFQSFFKHFMNAPTPIVKVGPNRWETAHIPLTAILSGPQAGSAIGPAYPPQTGDAPRAVSWEFFDQVCPQDERISVDVGEVRRKHGMENADQRSGKQILEVFAETLRSMNETCVALTGDHLWTFSDFGPHIIDAFDIMAESPILAKFAWSPLVQGIVQRNLPLLTDQPSRSAPSKVPGLLAAHLRRGDFEGHCKWLDELNAPYNSWNNFPDYPDRFIPDGSAPNKTAVFLEHCYPDVNQIVRRLDTIRTEWKGTPLKRLYFLTNAEPDLLETLQKRLTADGWKSVHSTIDLTVERQETEVDMAADMMIGQIAEVFVGNGWSSLTSNINVVRRGKKVPPESFRFW